MKVNLKTVTGGIATMAVAGGMLFAGATSASAATAPTYEPDANSQGAVTLYDASGAVETSGSINSHPFAAYFAGAGLGAGGTKATAYAFTPQDGVNPANWPNDTLTAPASFGPSVSAAYPGALKNSPNAIAVGKSSDFSLNDYIGEFPAASTTNPNIYAIRVETGDNAAYYTMDIQVTGTTWTQIYPAPATTSSVAAITASPASPAPSGSSVALSSTVSASDASHPSGSVELFDGSTDLGAATFTAATGAISKSISPADGSHSYTFVFTSTTTGVTGSTSPALAYSVNAPAPAAATTTTVSGAATATVGSPSTYTASVTTGTPASPVPAGSGKVQFSVDGTSVGAPVTVTATGASFQYTPADASAHTITASFTPTNTKVYLASADTTGVTVTATAPLYAADPQTVDVTVPQGSLVISTPYTAANPFHLGNLVLNSAGTSLDTVPVAFGDPTAAAATDPGQNASLTNGVTITDTRAASTGWTASAQTSDFTNTSASVIDGNDLSFTNVTPKYLTGNHLQAGSVGTNDISAFKTAKKSFATTTAGPGTVNITGKLALSGVPTSTLPGLYTATVTFTIG